MRGGWRAFGELLARWSLPFGVAVGAVLFAGRIRSTFLPTEDVFGDVRRRGARPRGGSGGSVPDNGRDVTPRPAPYGTHCSISPPSLFSFFFPYPFFILIILFFLPRARRVCPVRSAVRIGPEPETGRGSRFPPERGQRGQFEREVAPNGRAGDALLPGGPPTKTHCNLSQAPTEPCGTVCPLGPPNGARPQAARPGDALRRFGPPRAFKAPF